MVERVVSNDEAPGSKPGFSIILFYINILYYKCQANVAQWLVHLLRKQRVTSSNLVVGWDVQCNLVIDYIVIIGRAPIKQFQANREYDVQS